ncbi:MAG: hypothetical protein H7Y37_20385 [Anaerolineae bacterium]|nr:hypothetical protein [Gloeobacterales cyanobacterium ES-bin-313]
MKNPTIQNQNLSAFTRRNVFIMASIAMFSLCSGVQAASLVTERSALGANDLLNWSSVAPPFTFLSSTFTAPSVGGLGVTVSIPTPTPPVSQPFVFQNGSAIPTNFGDGDFILFTGLNFSTQAGNPGPLTLTFAQPVFAAGAQLLPDEGGAFIGFISAFDLNNTLLGSFQLDGVVTTARDNSAIFLGVSSDTANISRLVFSTSIPNVGIGINQLSIVAVPEPSMWPGLLLFTSMFLGAYWLRRTTQGSSRL